MATNGESTTHTSSVPLPEIPVKLRCTICSGLAQGAVRLPCCEQSICESCRTNLPDVCPVCDHSPLSADDCKPNVALRTTVAVFLRTAEKKHALSLQKEQKAFQKPEEAKPEIKASEPPVDKPNSIPERTSGSPVQKASATLQTVEPNGQIQHNEQPATFPEEKQTSDPPEMSVVDSESTPISQENGYEDNQQNGWFNSQAPDQMSTQQQQIFQGQGYPTGNGWGPYSQMMPDMANGWSDGFGSNMMGYPMMMNPMTLSQAGYNGGDYGNMGPGGIGGGFNGGGNGMGWNNGWNGQGNMGFNPGMNGMRNGGYYSAASAGGYNHQSHGNPQLPAQQYQNPHFQRQQATPRGGSSGSAAGGFSSLQQQSTYTPERPQSQQPDIDEEGGAIFLQQLQGIDEAVAAVKASGANDENQGKGDHNEDKQGEKIPSVVSNDPENITADPKDIPTETASTVVAGSNEDIVDNMTGLPPPSSVSNAPMNKPNAAQYAPVDDLTGQGLHQQMQQLPPTRPHSQHAQPPPTQPQQAFHPGHRGNFRGNMRGTGFRGGFGAGRGGYYPADAMPHSISPLDKKPLNGPGVEGAPTGPKAMREGGANRGMIRGRGGFVTGRGNFGPNWARSISPTDQPRERDTRDKGRSYSPSISGESRRRSRSPRDRDTKDHARYRSRSKDRSRTRRRRSKSRERRRRSPSVDSELRGRSPTREEKSLPSPVEDDAHTPIVPSDVQEDAKDFQRQKRSRESSESRVRSISESRSPSRSPDRRHKRSRRHKNRSASPEKSSRHHKRSHRRSRRYRDRSHTRSRSPREPRKEDASEDDKAAGPREDDVQVEKRARRESRDREKDRERDRDRERRHRKRSRRDDSRDRSRDRHRSHRHKTKHERSDRKDAEGDELSERRESQDLSIPPKAVEKKQSRLSRSDRKVSVKYEDELDLTRQAERDREAERWGVK